MGLYASVDALVLLSLENSVPAGLSNLGPIWMCSPPPTMPMSHSLLLQEKCAHRIRGFISASFPVSIFTLTPVWQPADSTSCFQRKQNLLCWSSHVSSFRNKEACVYWKPP